MAQQTTKRDIAQEKTEPILRRGRVYQRQGCTFRVFDGGK